MTDPDVPFSWRQDKKLAGSGALGDMASHVLSLSQFLVGDITEVCGVTEIFVKERPVAAAGTGYGAQAEEGAPLRAVENDDVCIFLARFESGAIGTIESSRIGTGRKQYLTFEVHGSKGAMFFNDERMNELLLYRHTDPVIERGYKTILTNPEQPWYGSFHPIAGIELGYNDQKVIETRALIEALAAGKPAEPDFRFGYKILQVVDAVLLSVDERRWVRTDEVG
jgi:predicted dehydrogenase